ncbi:hypothetical protein PMAYCL1PPCAC_10177, partial [Pristionchus mayeri]
SLLSISFCLLPPSLSFHARLLSSLRAGCVPVVLSPSQPLPFQDYLDWRQASLRFPLSMIEVIPKLLEGIFKEEVMELRRRGRVVLARIDDAEALSKSLVAALAKRIQTGLPMHPEVPSHAITPNDVFKNRTFKAARIKSKFGAQNITTSRMYSSARWNSGRDLTYTPRIMHDVPMMPGDAPFYEGTQENLEAGATVKKLGLTRDAEQFTVMILTYDRDEDVKLIIEKLRDCPYLNKVIIIWNNLIRMPNGTWPQIHVPVEFVLSERNNLNSRFLPYDNIETEAVVSIDDDMDLGQPELMHHRFKDGSGSYGLSGTCEHSMILTSFAFLHKEFLFEYTYNQHPAILEFVEKHRNCEDIAMNFLVSHLTRKPPLKVVKKTDVTNGAKPGLSKRGNHYLERNECIQMFTAIYGYNPLLISQEVAKPSWSCANGL